MLSPPTDAAPLDRLLSRRPATHIRWGLDRTRTMLAELGDPERRFRVFHVAGTNGKGSAAASVAAILTASGRRAGLYTSPHLIDFRERIQVDGRPVRESILQETAAAVGPLAEQVGATYFEAATALAFGCLAAEEVDAAAVETGLGGRLDATNVVRPAACAITSIGVDHAELLGGSLEQIAAEKAGILKPGIPVAAADLTLGARRAVADRADRVGAPIAFVGREARVGDVSVGPSGTEFTYRSARFGDGLRLRTPLIGRHQAENAALALLTLEVSGEPLDASTVGSGMAAVRLPGRFQRLPRWGTDWVLDIAHNPAGIGALKATLAEIGPGRPWVGLVSILADKPWREMLASLAGALDGVVLTVAPSAPVQRRWDVAEAVRTLPGAGFARARPSFGAALRDAAELARGGTVIVTGSAHTVGDAMARLEACEPDDPRSRHGAGALDAI